LNAAHHGFVDVADRLGRSVSAKSSDAELQRPNSTLNENFRQEKLLQAANLPNRASPSIEDVTIL
jgi:hypothetical protein